MRGRLDDDNDEDIGFNVFLFQQNNFWFPLLKKTIPPQKKRFFFLVNEF